LFLKHFGRRRFNPYDLIASQWARSRASGGFREKPYVERFVQLARPQAHILDLGFGTGQPIGRHLLDHGYPVTGVDSSVEMLRLGAKNCPEAVLVLRDILKFRTSDSYGGVVAWDSIFHVPKERHARLFESIHEWLNPGGPFLLSLGGGGSEEDFTDLMFGVEFFYSGHAPSKSIALLEKCGFEIDLAEIDDPTSRGHLAIICRKTDQRASKQRGETGLRTGADPGADSRARGAQPIDFDRCGLDV
jgi:SAM-dependent methyltransferase